MKPHYLYFWDCGQYGLLVGRYPDGTPMYLLPADPAALYEPAYPHHFRDQPSPDSFFAYEERPRLH